MRHAGRWVAAVAVLTIPLVGFASGSVASATPAAVNGPVTIRVELDLPNPGADGPAVFQVTDVVPGPGVELTGADLIDNPSDWEGSLTVDIDPAAGTIVVATEVGTDWQTARVTITGLPFKDLTAVSDTLWATNPSTEMLSSTVRSITDGITLYWYSSPSTNADQMADGGSADYTYSVVDMSVAPNPATTADQIAIAGDTCPGGTVTLNLSNGTDSFEPWTVDPAEDGTWTSGIGAGILDPGSYTLSGTCASDGSWDYLPVAFTVTAPVITTTTATAAPADAVPVTPAFTG